MSLQYGVGDLEFGNEKLYPALIETFLGICFNIVQRSSVMRGFARVQAI